jgi:hypothetical protein
LPRGPNRRWTALDVEMDHSSGVGRPAAPCCESLRQKSLNPFLCRPITVSGLTRRADRRLAQIFASHT